MGSLRDKLSRFMGNGIEIRDKAGKPHNSNFDISKLNVNQAIGGGTSREYRIAVLKRDAPDLAEKVVNGEIKAAAGKRRREIGCTRQ